MDVGGRVESGTETETGIQSKINIIILFNFAFRLIASPLPFASMQSCPFPLSILHNSAKHHGYLKTIL